MTEKHCMLDYDCTSQIPGNEKDHDCPKSIKSPHVRLCMP